MRIFRVVIGTKCCKHCKSQALPASKERGVQDGDVDVHDVVLRARFGGITQSASAFSAGTASSRGPVLGPDQAVLRRLTLGGRTVPTPFFCSKVAIEFPQDLGGLRPRHRTTLCSQSVKFRRAPYGPDTQRHSRHRTVLQQPGPRPHIISKLQSQGHVYFSLLQSTTIYRTGTVLTQCYSGSLSSDTSLMGKGWVSNAFGPTNVFPDAW